MTNRDIIAHAIAEKIVDQDALLARVLSGECASRPARTNVQGKSAAGWLCTACMVCLILVGYFNGNITLRMQGTEETALAGDSAFDATVEESGFFPQPPPAPESTPLFSAEEPAPQNEEPYTAPIAQTPPPFAPLQDGWVRTSQEVNAEDKPYEPNYEVYTGDSGSGGSGSTIKPKPEKPTPPTNGDGDPTNPDTGGGGAFFEVPYLQFVTDSAYSAYHNYVPSNLIGFSAFPLVGYNPPDGRGLGSATINYGNPGGTTKQVFSVIVQGHPENAPLITTSAQITPALLQKLNGLPPKEPISLLISVNLTIQNRQVCFESQNISYEQAAQVLQSLHALKGGATPS